MQRVSQLLVSFMIFMAVGEGVNKAVDVSVIQCFVAMGSNCVPIPGAMGVADYIMIDGFKQLVGSNAANMELLCRGIWKCHNKCCYYSYRIYNQKKKSKIV